MSGIEWAEPPPPRRGRHSSSDRWRDVADALRQRPGEWARVKQDGKYLQTADAPRLFAGSRVNIRVEGHRTGLNWSPDSKGIRLW